jgi:small subunit ribosomal protein S19
MIRSRWKPFFSKVSIFKKIFLKSKEDKTLIIFSKDLLIFPSFVGNVFLVYNGKQFTSLQIFEFMVGYKFSKFIRKK